MQKTYPTGLILALLLVSMLLCSISVQSVRGALVQDTSPLPTVRIQPENATVKKGVVFSVRIIIENIPADPGMTGVEFIMSWNASVLNALNMTEVMFHNVTPQAEWDNIWEVRNTFNNTAGILFNGINYTAGYALYAYTFYDVNRAHDGGYAAVSSNQTLATVKLEAMEAGSTTLHLSSLMVGSFSFVDQQVVKVICSPDSDYGVPPLLPSLIIDASINVSSGLKEDINGDGIVDLFDALLLAQHFGSKQSDTTWDPNVDMNNDGEIDIFDFLVLASNYGKKT
jgi:hypothetical protein